jgi:nitrogen fixation/metabolism regulation signal transduction histidine kinase
MAKQVAYEIKNPLTQCATFQSFQRKFDPNDPESNKMDDYSETLIQQIDTIMILCVRFFKFCFHACPTK